MREEKKYKRESKSEERLKRESLGERRRKYFITKGIVIGE